MDSEMDGYRTESEKLLDSLVSDVFNIEHQVYEIKDKVENLEIDIQEAKEELKNYLITELVYVVNKLEQEIKQKYTIHPITELFIWGYSILGLVELYKHYF
jgi:hypothetical protein